MHSSHARPEHPGVPADFKLEIPNQFKNMFMIPLKPLGSWNDEKGSWNDKAPAGIATSWQTRSTGFTIPSNATSYGIPAGKNGLLMVDLDQKKTDEDGIANFDKLVDEHGSTADTDKFFTMRTGSGAIQHIFTITDENAAKLKPTKGSTQNGLELGIDTRVNNSFSVGPGSLVTQPDNSVGLYELLTPDAEIPALEDFPWLLELLVAASTGTRTNPSLLVRKQAEKATSTATNTTPAPKLTSQKGEKALEPLVQHLLDLVEADGKRHPNLMTVGRKAGERGVPEEKFVEVLFSKLRELAADAASIWNGYDLAKAEVTVREFWAKGYEKFSEKAEMDTFYGPDAISIRFATSGPVFKWVVSKEKEDDNSGQWHRYNSNPSSKECGIYEPLAATTLRQELVEFLKDEADAAEKAGDAVKNERARRAYDTGSLLDEVLKRLKGTKSIRAYHEDFDSNLRAGNIVVDGSGLRNLDTMEVSPYSPNHLATRKFYLKGDENAYKARLADIDRIMCCKEEDRPFLEAFLGTVLREQQPLSKKGVIIHGPTKDNGKTTLVEILQAIMGKFALKTTHELVHKNSKNPYAEAELDIRTLTILDDFSADREVDTEKLKQYIGSGTMYQARQIGERTRSMRLYHTFLITCNRLPKFGRREEVIDRFEIVEFPYKFAADNIYDPNNPWHKKRDPHFASSVWTDVELQEAFYYYLLKLHKAHADSDGRIEIDSINESIEAHKEVWKSETNVLHALLSEYAAPDKNSFVSEATLFAFVKHTLEQQMNMPYSRGTFKNEMDMLHLLKVWGVNYVVKTDRTKRSSLKDLQESKWHEPFGALPQDSPKAANIYVGMRLKTNDVGKMLDEDEWNDILKAQELSEALAEGRTVDDVEDELLHRSRAEAAKQLSTLGIPLEHFPEELKPYFQKIAPAQTVVSDSADFDELDAELFGTDDLPEVSF